jgi:hypothetical protein
MNFILSHSSTIIWFGFYPLSCFPQGGNGFTIAPSPASWRGRWGRGYKVVDYCDLVNKTLIFELSTNSFEGIDIFSNCIIFVKKIKKIK